MPETNDITPYIPQRRPFVMVDKILSATEDQTVTTFNIQDDNLFCEKGLFYEAGLIENVAQTVAAGAGYRLRKKNEEPKIGFIGAVKNLKIECRPKSGTTIKTIVKLITIFENAMIVQGTIFDNEKTILTCQMNIFIIDNPNL
ncbi:MAG: hypothetical protein PVF73_03800 [Bacteroidales bacterium]|jgi:predicted hotdog family 3-hydroxylacyl-ACP dehydratase